MYAFTELALAAYCPRKLYYRRQADDFHSSEDPAFELAFRYDALLDPATDLSTEPIALSPTQYRRALRTAASALDRFTELSSPTGREVFLTGKDAHGIAHKVLDDPPAVSMVSVGTPPTTGVWESHAVRAVAATKALSYEREHSIDRTFVEYVRHGCIRELELTGRRRAQYQRALRTVETLADPPGRVQNGSKCTSCAYRERCGVRTESLLTRLFG